MFAILSYLLFNDCRHVCDYAKPYGWVPEACCPVHDPDTRLHYFIMWFVRQFRRIERPQYITRDKLAINQLYLILFYDDLFGKRVWAVGEWTGDNFNATWISVQRRDALQIYDLNKLLDVYNELEFSQ